MHRCWFFVHGLIKQYINFKGIFIVIFFSLLWWQCGRWYQSFLLEQQAEEFNYHIKTQSDRLSSLISNRLELLNSLNLFVQTELNTQAKHTSKIIPPQKAMAFLSGLRSSHKSIRNFALAPNGIINFVSPLVGNQQALGHNLMQDKRPASSSASQRAIRMQRVALTNPLELLQGGLGVVARQPVMHQSQNWGLISMTIDILPLLQESGFIDLSNSYHLALRDRDGQVFFGQAETFAAEHSVYRVVLADGYWEMAAQPLAGKSTPGAEKLLIFKYGFAALLILILAAIFIYRNYRHSKPSLQTTASRHLDIEQPSWIAPALATAALVVASLAFYWYLQQENKSNEKYNLDTRLNSLEQNIQRKLAAHRDYFSLIAQQIAAQRISPDEYQSRVSQYVEDHHGLVNVTWADNEFVIRYTAPFEPNKQVVGLSLSLPEPERASRLAMLSRGPVYTKPFVVIQGHPAFELYLPIFNGDQFKGTLGLVYSLEELMESSIPKALNLNYKIELLDRSGVVVYSNSQQSSPHQFKSKAIGSLQQELWLRLSPQKMQNHQSIRQLLLVAGIMIFGIGISLWLQFRESRILWNRGEELRQSQKHFRAIAQSSPMAIIIVAQKSGEIIFANALAERFLKGDKSSILGDQIHLYCPRDSEYQNIQRLIRERQAVVNEEVMLQDSNGHQFWAAVSLKSVQYDGQWALISSITDLSERKRHEDKLFQQANYDSLTGLPNRGLAFDRLQRSMVRAQRGDFKIALMMVDLDHFKIINDKFGHNSGDQVLQKTAKRLNKCVRAGDTVARLGGDEFTLILPELHSAIEAEHIAEKIIQTCLQPMMVNGHELQISASIGITIFPNDGSNRETLLKNADIAMYKCKEDGRNHFRFYTQQMNQQAQALLEKEVELRQALSRNELDLHYQPLFNTSTETVEGVEVLLRWNSQKFGPVSPAEFIPMAESMGIINELGEWVLRNACEQIKTWRQHKGMPRYVSVNVSGNQFRQGKLIKIVQQALSDSKLEPSALQLEITESVLLDHTEDTRRTLQIIHDLGVSLAIDDFGTGYSSLSYLRRFPFDTLKIDRAFVKDVPGDGEAEQLVNAIISMANILGLKTVAEGVESQHQQDYLSQLNCAVLQGFYLSKPMPANAFEQRYLPQEVVEP